MENMADHNMEQFLKDRKKAALHIDPETAQVDWTYGETMDPYGSDPDLPNELQCIGRIYSARSPGSELWVCFGDLPEKICSALWERHRRNLAFPAGLSLTPEEEVKLKLRSDETQ